ncbi:MAG: phosphoenolpyruvate--protein phosphotransferase [Syntrophaceae bacterium]|nr:phosphoenolpyruvate--protein phosphotransferase [Syntrophaceae bacterium]
MHEEISKWFLKGIAASPGIVIGKAYVFQDILLMVERRNLEEAHAEEEVAHLKEAIRQVTDELMEDNSQLSLRIGKKEAEIFLAHLAILKDPYFIARILKDIREDRVDAESAVLRQIDEFGEAFNKMGDPYLRERGADIRDIGRRIIGKLTSTQEPPWDFKEPVILVTSELAPSDTVRLDKKKVLAFVTELGGRDSHAAILARSLGIPAVLGIEGLLSKVKKGDTLIVDGDTGIVLIRPPLELIQNYHDLQRKRESYQTELCKLVSLPCETLGGREIRLWANIGGLTDLEYALRFGAYGIGLFRTELPFLVWRRFLSEDEQFSLYQKVVTEAAGREVTIRTLDFGGDKFFEDGKSQKEKNPFLGYRSIRVFLKEKDLFKQQLRAILRASAYGPVKILFPMISNIGEVTEIRDLFESTKKELQIEGIPFDEGILFGVMIEIPSVAILADQIAKEVDFLSIGTNDLTQYTLAVDRDNDLVKHLYDPLNPAVLRLIRNVVEVANRTNKQITLCGEMAGTAAYIPLLLGIGLTDLSMNPSCLLEAKKIVRSVKYEHWQSVAKRVFDLASAQEINNLISVENGRVGIRSQDGPITS